MVVPFEKEKLAWAGDLYLLALKELRLLFSDHDSEVHVSKL